MIRLGNGDRRWLTDAQWLALMALVKDDARYAISYPTARGESAHVVMPDETRREVKPDGNVITP